MKLQIDRYSIKIIPESEIDKAYLEEILGLKQDVDRVDVRRVNAVSLSCWAYLEIKKRNNLFIDRGRERWR